MAAALVFTGLGYVVTAAGLHPADVAGRAVLGVGGGAVLLTASIPNASAGRNTVSHMIATYLAYRITARAAQRTVSNGFKYGQIAH